MTDSMTEKVWGTIWQNGDGDGSQWSQRKINVEIMVESNDNYGNHCGREIIEFGGRDDTLWHAMACNGNYGK